MQTRVLNPDGTPFFANLHADSGITVTVNEAYILSNNLRDQARVMRQMADKFDPRSDAQDFRDAANRLDVRADRLDVMVEDAKRQQAREAGLL